MHGHGNMCDNGAFKVHRWRMNMQVVVKVTAEWGGEVKQR